MYREREREKQFPRKPRVSVIDRIPGGVQGRLGKHLRDGTVPRLASPHDLCFPGLAGGFRL